MLRSLLLMMGSPDNTRDVAHDYREKIVYLEQKNKGLAAARNSGVAMSSGAWLQFLDADDLLFRHKIEWQLGDLLKNGASWVTVARLILELPPCL